MLQAGRNLLQALAFTCVIIISYCLAHVALMLKIFFFISEAEVSEHSTGITHLPPEVMLSIFSYLNPQELCRCSQVSTKWSQLAKTGSLWKHLYPVHWARGR